MRATRVGILLAGVMLLGSTPAVAYQVPVEPFGQGERATATMPGSGLTTTISATGATELLDASTAGQRGARDQTYAPPIARTTPAQDVVVNTGTCAAVGTCDDRGTVTIAFSQPVRNPVLHFAGLGGAVTQTVNGRPARQSEVHAELRLSTAGLSLTKAGQGDNFAVTGDTVTAANHDAGPSCVNTRTGTGPDAGATAACGSVRVNGIVTSVSFTVTAVFTKNPALPAHNTASSGDAFSVLASAGEDFGDAPASYGAAWSVLTDLRLGPAATEDHATVPNATTGPPGPDQGDDSVQLKPLLTIAKTYSATVELTGATKPGRACGWLDHGRDGKFQPVERSCASFAAGQSAVTLNWSGLAKLVPGSTYLRLRAGYTSSPGRQRGTPDEPTGAADSGEVEDHVVPIKPPPPPVPADDRATTPYNTGTTVNVLGNDKPGSVDAPLRPDSLCLLDGAACKVMVPVVGQGKYVAKPTGHIDFEPVPGFVGPGKPVRYRIADANGTTATAALTITVALPDKPVAEPDTATTAQNISLAIKLLANDKAAPGVTLDLGSIVLRDPADGLLRKKVGIPSEGSYQVKPNGTVDFVPLPQFTGVATSLGYQVTDSTRQTAESTLVVTVTPVIPRALADAVTTPFDTAVTIEALGNDLPGSPDAPLDPAGLRLVDPVTGKLVTLVAVPRQGTYQVTGGEVIFTPVHGFRGVVRPVTYQVLDKNGTAARATITVSVDAPGPPVLNSDTAVTLQGQAVLIPVLDNDRPGTTGAAIVPDTLRLSVSVTVPGEGRYTVRPEGRVLFEPIPSFSGKTKPVEYQVADTNGAIGRSTLAVQVTKVQPTATNDTATTKYDTTFPLDVLANDAAGDPAVPLVPSSVRLVDPLGNESKSRVVVPGEAAYTVQPDGTVEVDPLPTFTGVATPLAYTVADVNGTIARAKLTVTIAKPPPPIAQPDTATGMQNVRLRIDPLGNDESGLDASAETNPDLDPLSLVLIDPADGTLRKLVKVPGQGAYAVQPDGTVVFDPLPGFTGATTPLVYRVSDWFDQPARSTIAITITPVVPEAVDDVATTPFGRAVAVRVLANDKAGDPSAPLQPSTLLLTDPADGLLKKTVTIRDEGVYTAAGGVVSFDPGPVFRGPGTVLSYQVADSNGTLTTATLWVTVGLPPVALPDQAVTKQDLPVDTAVLANDSPGTEARLDPSSVVLLAGTLRSPVKEVIVPGQGTYTVQRGGGIRFDPLPTFRGRAKPITYRVADSHGNLASAPLLVEVTPIWPVPVDDSAITPHNTAITVDVLVNDQAGDPSAPLVRSSVLLKDPVKGDYRKTVTQAGEGTYTAGPDSRVTFTPVKGFQGVTTPAIYRIADDNGSTAEGLLFLTVGRGPVAAADTATTRQNTRVVVDPLANDKAGTGAELEKASVQLFGPLVRSWARTVTIPGQGTYKVDAVTGRITFEPVPAYNGPSTVAYRVTDTSRNETASIVTVTVQPVVPALVADKAETPYATAVTVPVLANDKPGHESAPLVPGSVRVLDPVSGDGVVQLRVPGQGTYTVQPDGRIRHMPVAGFTGTGTPVGYEVTDANGTVASGTLVVTVQDRPVAQPDLARTKQNAPVLIDALGNDKPGPGSRLDPSTLLLVNTAGELVSSVSVPGQGSYAVADGKVRFTPVKTFVGTAGPIGYEVKDGNRNAARSTLKATVDPVRPVAGDDRATTAFGRAVVIQVLANDKPGDPSVPLVPGSVLLRDPVDGRDKPSVVIAREGSFAARPDGSVEFTPAKGFTGTTRAISYRVLDTNGTADAARLDVTVSPPSGAAAGVDTATGTPGNPVIVNPLLNDKPNTGATLDPGGLCLVAGTGTCTKRLVGTADTISATTAADAGPGTWTVLPNGTIRFAPDPRFRGVAEITYRVPDTTGHTLEAQLRITIGAAPAPILRPVASTLPAVGGPPMLALTLGTLLAALGLTLLAAAHRSRRP